MPVTIGSYRPLRLLGTGSMGTVYLAVPDRQPEARCALKVLHRKFVTDTEPFERFLREIAIGRTLTHRNLCQVFDAGSTHDGTVFLAMEYLEGRPLDEVIKTQAPLHLLRAMALIQQLLEGLQVIHGAGVVHRDLKPENLFVTDDNILKILDFGLARVRLAPVRLEQSLTRTGNMLGTPAFASPEQIVDAKRVDHRSDLFSVGAIFYTMMTGQQPFQGSLETVLQDSLMADGGPNLQDARPDTPTWAEMWKRWLMRRDQLDRPQSAAEALARLRV